MLTTASYPYLALLGTLFSPSGSLSAEQRAAAGQAAALLDIYRPLVETVDAILAEMPEREQFVLCQRYGLSDGQFRTWQEIGASVGIARERIRQIEDSVLRTMREPARRLLLRPWLPLVGQLSVDSDVSPTLVQSSTMEKEEVSALI